MIEKLNNKEEIKNSISIYKRMGIDMEIVEYEIDYITIIIKQSRLVNGYILTGRQLHDRAVEVFEPCGLKLRIRPAVYIFDHNEITIDWIESKMIEFDIKKKDIIKQLAIDKSTLSRYFSRERKLNKSVKGAFFYYFLTYELNRDFREGEA